MTKKIYVIHENDDWTSHLIKRLEELNLPYETWHLDEGIVDLNEVPPEGVFYNRMSASSHTRNHRFAPELTGAVIDWLEFHGRKVLNGSNALRLELSKVKQYTQLEKCGVRVPKTVAAVGKGQIMEAAKTLNTFPFITKHNRAGKGLGVQLFYSLEALQEHLDKPTFEDSVDGITLVQQYVSSPDQSITRVEFVGGEYVYSVRVDTSEGFELCPADACQIGDLFCPVGEEPKDQMKFRIVENPRTELIERYKRFLKENSIDVAGIEFIVNEEGTAYTYDVNTNTNYNSDAEEQAQKFGMLELAKLLGRELENLN
ncbi:ATP-grasp domain-containing protein [Ureibacillus sinduriensis]|uniref:Alpha-L-glutamate ligase n=1 Tax=Ureibacillus sinduriensis BLB-1 = JCM 15800 TaxID=1384057 RepID=A0A0A3HYG0_9BACL|nr:alpha-L-glutamate ligase [Ureibacillus sinduriensis]KGR75403.1 alpha-L-glutamate ligase [Ureibacillus sinduriensis BLB-1 = JCM 15800]